MRLAIAPNTPVGGGSVNGKLPRASVEGVSEVREGIIDDAEDKTNASVVRTFKTN